MRVLRGIRQMVTQHRLRDYRPEPKTIGGLEIRLTRPEDSVHLNQVISDSFQRDDIQVEQLLWNSNITSLTAVSAGQPVGIMCLVRGSTTLTDKPSLEMGNLAIDRHSRGNGIGRALLKRGLEIAKETGLEPHLAVRTENTKAKSLYDKLGFELTPFPWGAMEALAPDSDDSLFLMRFDHQNPESTRKLADATAGLEKRLSGIPSATFTVKKSL